MNHLAIRTGLPPRRENMGEAFGVFLLLPVFFRFQADGKLLWLHFTNLFRDAVFPANHISRAYYYKP